MNSSENYKIVKPTSGQIGMILHKGGEYDPKTNTIKDGEIITQKEIKNLIVDRASVLMACRLSPGATTGKIEDGSNDGTFLADGLQYLAIGVGILQNPSLPYDPITNKVNSLLWDLQNPPAEELTTVKLQGELFRKPFTSWSFVNPDGTDSTTPTNILKLVTTFYESEAVGPLTEMGLFGGTASDWDNGNGKDTGYMFNYKTFPVWNKPSDSRLTISWKLTF
jgi:hypothetical protein